MHNDDIVHLATATNPPEAHLWRQALEGEGIRCHVVGEYLDGGGERARFRAAARTGAGGRAARHISWILSDNGHTDGARPGL